MPSWVSAVRAVSQGLGVLSALLILVSVLVVCHMVFVRAVLGQSSIWQTEFATFCVLGATFLGAPYILLTRGHVNVDLLPIMCAGKLRRTLYFLSTSIALAFCLIFLYASIPWCYEAWEIGLTTASIWRVPLWIPYLSVPIGLGLLCLQFIADVWLVIIGYEEPFGLEPGVHV